MELIIDIVTKAGYKKYLVWTYIKKQMKKLNDIENVQKNRISTNEIPFNRYASIKNEGAKADFYIPIKPNPNILQWIQNDHNPINLFETSEIYNIEYKNEEEERGSYIGMTRRKRLY